MPWLLLSRRAGSWSPPGPCPGSTRFSLAIFRSLSLMRKRPGHRQKVPATIPKMTPRPAGTAAPAISFDERQIRTRAMTPRRLRSDRGAQHVRETLHRRSRAFDDPGADQLDEWMAACPAADAPKPSA